MQLEHDGLLRVVQLPVCSPLISIDGVSTTLHLFILTLRLFIHEIRHIIVIYRSLNCITIAIPENVRDYKDFVKVALFLHPEHLGDILLKVIESKVPHIGQSFPHFPIR